MGTYINKRILYSNARQPRTQNYKLDSIRTDLGDAEDFTHGYKVSPP